MSIANWIFQYTREVINWLVHTHIHIPSPTSQIPWMIIDNEMSWRSVKVLMSVCWGWNEFREIGMRVINFHKHLDLPHLFICLLLDSSKLNDHLPLGISHAMIFSNQWLIFLFKVVQLSIKWFSHTLKLYH